MSVNVNKKDIIQFIKFGMVGVVNTVVDWVAAFLFLLFVWNNQYMAQTVGFCVGLLNSYFMNKNWTFEKAEGGYDKFFRFALVGIVGLLASLLMFYILRGISTGSDNIDFLLKKAVATIIVTTVNFLGSKFFVFNTAGKSDEN